MNTENLKNHLRDLGMEIVKIDTAFSDTPKMPTKQMVAMYKQRTDLQETAAFINYLVNASEGKLEEKTESRLVKV